MAWARTHWKKAPQYALLVGDGSFDPRNFLGLGDVDFVPTKLIDTAYLETASDDWFVDFNDDGLPEMAIGRLPVRTVEELDVLVSKIVGYRQAAPMQEAVLVADINDTFNYETVSEELRGLLPSSIVVRKIFRGDFGTDGEARNALIGSINQGPLLVNYFGHGSVEVWNGGILNSGDAVALTNGWRLPFFINMTCFNGMFHDVYTESLSEALLKAEGGGAVAVWASSGSDGARGAGHDEPGINKGSLQWGTHHARRGRKRAKAATLTPMSAEPGSSSATQLPSSKTEGERRSIIRSIP